MPSLSPSVPTRQARSRRRETILFKPVVTPSNISSKREKKDLPQAIDKSSSATLLEAATVSFPSGKTRDERSSSAKLQLTSISGDNVGAYVQDMLHILVDTTDQTEQRPTPSEFLSSTISGYPADRRADILSRFAVDEAPKIKAVAAVARVTLPASIYVQARKKRRVAAIESHSSALDTSWAGTIDDWLPIEFRPSSDGPGRHRNLDEQTQCIRTITDLAMDRNLLLPSLWEREDGLLFVAARDHSGTNPPVLTRDAARWARSEMKRIASNNNVREGSSDSEGSPSEGRDVTFDSPEVGRRQPPHTYDDDFGMLDQTPQQPKLASPTFFSPGSGDFPDLGGTSHMSDDDDDAAVVQELLLIEEDDVEEISQDENGRKEDPVPSRTLAIERLKRQLTSTSTMMTDDVMQLLCTMINPSSSTGVAAGRKDSHRIIDPLWLQLDTKRPTGPLVIDASDILYIPVHYKRACHWTLINVIVDAANMYAIHYDSLKHGAEARKEKADAALRCWLSRQPTPTRQLHSSHDETSPSQHDAVSCGVFVLGILRRLLSEQKVPATMDAAAERRALLTIAEEALKRDDTAESAKSREPLRFLPNEHDKESDENILLLRPTQDGKGDDSEEQEDSKLDDVSISVDSGRGNDEDDDQVLTLLDPDRATRREAQLKTELELHTASIARLKTAIQSTRDLITCTKTTSKARQDHQALVHQADHQRLQETLLSRPAKVLEEWEQQEKSSSGSQSRIDSMQRLLETTTARVEDSVRAILSDYDSQGKELIQFTFDSTSHQTTEAEEGKLASLRDDLHQQQLQVAVKTTELKLLQNLGKARVVKRTLSRMDNATVKRVRAS